MTQEEAKVFDALNRLENFIKNIFTNELCIDPEAIRMKEECYRDLLALKRYLNKYCDLNTSLTNTNLDVDKKKEQPEEMKIYFLCDRRNDTCTKKACVECAGNCHHTDNIRHALNFIDSGNNTFFEQEKD